MAKLLTSHDPYHIHAVLGALVLLHFIYRWNLIFTTGNAFPDGGNIWLQSLCVLLHTLLPTASLLLRLPTKRNFNKPMIWPEFRLHSLLFASRHVLATILALHGLANICVDLCLALGTATLATLISEKLGDPNQRTTNAMPYPENFNAWNIRNTKMFYASSQFIATAMMFTDDPSFSFMPLLAIQLAPFMMTLVRKGKASSTAYHVIYSWGLFFPVLGMFARGHFDMKTWPKLTIIVVLGYLTQVFRLRFRLNKYLVWFICPLIAISAKGIVERIWPQLNALAMLIVSGYYPFIANYRSRHTLFWYQIYQSDVDADSGEPILKSTMTAISSKAKETWEKVKGQNRHLIH